MDAIEKDNPTLKGVLPKDYARATPHQYLPAPIPRLYLVLIPKLG